MKNRMDEPCLQEAVCFFVAVEKENVFAYCKTPYRCLSSHTQYSGTPGTGNPRNTDFCLQSLEKTPPLGVSNGAQTHRINTRNKPEKVMKNSRK